RMEVDTLESTPHELPNIESQTTPDSLVAYSPEVVEGQNVPFGDSATNTEKQTKRIGKRRRKTLETEDNQTSVANSSQSCQKKRILPPRKVGTLASVLAEEVAANQETILMLTSDEDILQTCEIVEDNDINYEEETTMPITVENDQKDILIPSFKLWDEDVGSGLRSKAQEVDTSDAIYEKRHRKHELAEKKLKNREREKLEYERYQQQLAVEKLRNTDSKSLISIAALRSQDSTSDASKLETVHKKLLKEAEDQLARYDSLGLGGKKRKADVIINNISNIGGENKVTEEPENKKARLRVPRRTSNTNPDEVLTASSKNETSTRITRSRKNKDEKPVDEIKIINNKPTKSTENVTKMNHKKNNTKSTRSALAFGYKVPVKPFVKRDFSLPVSIFGEMMNERENLRLQEYQQQMDQMDQTDQTDAGEELKPL
ncbi:8168_t:CDS:2, partial [Gigaspora rosea]